MNECVDVTSHEVQYIRIFSYNFILFKLSGTIRTEGSAKPGEVIAKVADEEKATMIVMGTRGLGKVRSVKRSPWS